MKAKVFSVDGKAGKEVELPKAFSSKIRKDIVSKVLEAKRSQQPYSPSLTAGKQHSASGKLVHRRKVWRSGYGRGMARVPRKIHSRRGSHFNWVGAEVSSTRGGRRSHPPKTIAMMSALKVNKKELEQAFRSALSATANKEEISQRYGNISDSDISATPFVVENKLMNLKTKELISGLKKILGEDLFSKIEKKRSVRAGKGKLRGRKHKTNAGLLLVTGEKEKMRSSVIEIKGANKLGVSDLARGGLGRMTVYTEEAIKELGERLK